MYGVDMCVFRVGEEVLVWLVSVLLRCCCLAVLASVLKLETTQGVIVNTFTFATVPACQRSLSIICCKDK